MAKKKKNNEPPKKDITQMSDSEFITYADYLSSPYYRAYVNARIRAEAEGRQPQQSYGGGFTDRGRPDPGPLPKNRREKKRGVFLFLILLLMAVTLALAATYFVNVAAISPYASIYRLPGGRTVEVTDPDTGDVTVEKETAEVTLLDPAVGLIKNFVPLGDMKSEYYDRYVADGQLDEARALTKVAYFAVPTAAALILVCAVIGLLKALVALFSGKKSDGYYKKIGFGFLAIVLFLCTCTLAVGGLYFSGVGVDGAVDYFTFKSENFIAGYALYGLAGVSILTFLFTCLSYKKIKK